MVRSLLSWDIFSTLLFELIKSLVKEKGISGVLEGIRAAL